MLRHLDYLRALMVVIVSAIGFVGVGLWFLALAVVILHGG